MDCIILGAIVLLERFGIAFIQEVESIPRVPGYHPVDGETALEHQVPFAALVITMFM